MPNGIPQGGGAPGYSGPLNQQLRDIGKPLISKATQTTTQPGSFDPMQLMMMLYMMDVFKKDKTTEGQPQGDMGLQDIMKLLMGKIGPMAGGAMSPGGGGLSPF